MTAELLAGYAGVILSLVFSYLPGVESWYALLEATTKRLIMLGLLVLVAVGAFGLACAGWGSNLNIVVECTEAGAVGLAKVLFAAIVGNQAFYQITKRS